MNKKLLSAAVSAALVAPAAMAGDVTMYGKVHIATSSYDADIDTGDAWDISSHASRLGFKGSEDLGGSLKALWQIELGIRASDNDNNTLGESGVTYRNTFVGLTGNWGTAVIGRHDTPMKISTGSLDLFGDTIADYNGNGADDEPDGAGNRAALYTSLALRTFLPLLDGQGLGFVDLRVDQAIAYISPTWNGLTIAAAIVQPGMDQAQTLPFSVADNADGFAEAYSVAAMYSNGPFYGSLAWEQLSGDLIEEMLRASNTTQAIVSDETRWRAGVGYTANGLHVGLVYENQDHAFRGLDARRWQISGSYTLGNNLVKAMYGENRIECSASCVDLIDAPAGILTTGLDGVTSVYDGVDIDQWAIGLDHNFSKRTKAYLVYTDVDVDPGQPVLAPGASDGSWDGFSLGLVHSF
jgi:predicted porin